ncbi:MAG: hypothetical protein KBD85_04860, partial [Elusimicrobia bacterium]|nr:hypothetical protein [Elusimicrobiota bacterium]
METGRFFKIVAGGLGGVYFWANCLFAYSPETTFWAERRDRAARDRSSESTVAVLPGEARGASWPQRAGAIPAIGASLLGDQFSGPVKEGLPAGFLEKNQALFSVLARMPGTIRKISFPPRFTSSGPLVVYIQDVHRNEEAQRNIGATVAGLLEEGNAGLLALEGAYGTIPLQPFRDFQNRQAVRQAADYLLKENKISGPIHAVLSGAGPLCPVIGIDDPVHYAANVEAYQQAVSSQNEIQNSLRARARILDQEKKNVFSAPLLEFDGQVAAYRARQLSLGDFVQVLLSPSKGEPLSPTLRHYSEAVAMERAMDFAQVERERAGLIEQLARKRSPAQEKDLLAVTVAYRAGQLRPADFYGRLNRLCV